MRENQKFDEKLNEALRWGAIGIDWRKVHYAEPGGKCPKTDALYEGDED